MIIVADSSPLIALAMLGRLDLLELLFTKVIVPEAVYKEVGFFPKPFSNELKKYLKNKVKSIKDHLAAEILCSQIDPGESEAIIMALESNIQDILLDDLKARKLAIKQGLSPIGTIGVLIQAIKSGEDINMQEYLDILINNGYRISKTLYNAAIEKTRDK